MTIGLHTPPEPVVVVSLPRDEYRRVLEQLAGVEGFVTLTRDKAEITLILAAGEWTKLAAMFPVAQATGGRRLIRFEAILDFSLVGFLAEVSRLLAAAGISILAISTWQTDAILVEEQRFAEAVEIIQSSTRLAAIIGRE